MHQQRSEHPFKVAGIPIRKKIDGQDGQLEVCTHVPTKAVLNGKPEQRTTVGGAIEGTEIAFQTMERELLEEYGTSMWPHCVIIAMGEEPKLYQSASGELKYCWLFWIVVNSYLPMEINSAEVAEVFWEDYDCLPEIITKMSPGRHKMFAEVLADIAHPALG